MLVFMSGHSRDEKRRSARERNARERSMKKDLWNQRDRMLVDGGLQLGEVCGKVSLLGGGWQSGWS